MLVIAIALIAAPIEQPFITNSVAPVETAYTKKRKKAAASGGGRKFGSCAAARKAGYTHMRRGKAGYSANLDRDGDGVACDKVS